MSTALAPTFETIWFDAKDGFRLNFKRLAPKKDAEYRGPVIMVPGAGVRANLFNPPLPNTLPEQLSRKGFDVWMLNWRASIDLPANQYDLDDAAVLDMPAAVSKIREETKADEVKAVIHCQGSVAFMMAITAGLLPDVSVVVANSCGLHPVINRPAWYKLPLAMATLGRVVPYFNPQWGLHAPGFWPKVIDFAVRATHHECDNGVCRQASFTYGFGFPSMWDHDNLTPETHEWIKGEFAHVPVKLFQQIANSVAAGEYVSTGAYRDELPPLFTGAKPDTEARFVFMTGDRNRLFLNESMAKTFEYFERWYPGRNTFTKLAGYGHLDVFFGENSAEEVFPYIVDELSRPYVMKKKPKP
ncbi:MAG: hypothetical protein ABWY34_03350 [Pseudoxanthomonas sp.]